MKDVADENRDKLLRGVGVGTIATILMTGLLFAAPALGGGAPEAVTRALATVRSHPLLVVLALMFHFGYGALAGAIYSTAVPRVSIASGLFYGAILWGVAVAVYAPLIGLGFVASHEPALAALTLPAHLLYGVTLGALGPRGEIVQPIENSVPFTFADVA